jgi:uncharacterized protein (DUF1015 family)
LVARTPDAITHRLWRITDQRLFTLIGADLADRRAMIADGHHRYAAYRRLEAERFEAGDGRGPWSYGLAMLVDSARHPLEVRAIHRMLPKLRGEDAVAALRDVGRVDELPERFAPDDAEAMSDMTTVDGAGSVAGPSFLLVSGGRRWIISDIEPTLLTASVPRDRPPAWRDLDATILHYALIDRVWRQPDDPEHVTYHHDAVEAVRAAEQAGGVAVLLQPPDVSTVLELAALGQRMPRKSTSFGPKPRTGIVLRTLTP